MDDLVWQWRKLGIHRFDLRLMLNVHQRVRGGMLILFLLLS